MISLLLFFLLFLNSTYCLDILSIPIQTYGGIKVESFFDSRQVAGTQEDIALFFPLRKFCDVLGRDINAHPRFNLAALESRIGFKIGDFLINDVKILGLIETDFIGSIEENITGTLRMRLGFVRFQTEKAVILIGHFNHLLTPPDLQPETISLNTGVPIELYSRQCQFRYIRKINNLDVGFALHEQIDFRSAGPIGLSTTYLRNAILPDIAVIVRYNWGDSFCGMVFDYKKLVPRLKSDKCFKVNESIHSFIWDGFLKLSNECTDFKVKVIYAQNATEHITLGTYAVRTIDPVTDFRTYANVPSIAVWTEFIYYFKEKFEFGIFAGIVKKLGSNVPLFINPATQEPIIFSLAPEKDYVYRVSPRFIYTNGPLEIGVELELTGAASGKNNEFAKINRSNLVNNLRVLTAVWYNF